MKAAILIARDRKIVSISDLKYLLSRLGISPYLRYFAQEDMYITRHSKREVYE